jgi:amino acid adenylation domain-containing protein
MLTEAEQYQIMEEWNPGHQEYRKDKTLCQLFAEQAERNGDRIAVSCRDLQVSFAALNRRSNQIAHRLRRSGVGPESVVALLLGRSAEMVVALLGVLKAGGAYLPLDPDYPPARLALMLEDVRPAVLLTEPEFVEKLPAYAGEVICLTPDWQAFSLESEESLESGASAENLAYIIYTSGSTGRPKGVMVSHHNVVRLLTATIARFNFDREDVWVLFHSYAFDFSVWEVWGALSTGARLIVTPYWVSRCPEAIYDLLQAEKVTVLNQTPSAFRQLMPLALSSPENMPLRFVIFGGEALNIDSLKPWVEKYDDEQPQLINMYGITETTVHVTYRRLRKEDIEHASSSLIGRPIEDLKVLVLNADLQLAPVRVAGELFVGGGGLGRGYWGKPEITAGRFIPDAHGKVAGQRLYSSGDFGRYLPNGDVEYLGRKDGQVKIRGFRIELGEVQRALAAHESVSETAVTTQVGEDGQTRLIAYVVARPETPVSVTQLRAFLLERLPEWMVPSALFLIEMLPLTANNKVDWRALPEPNGTRPNLDRPFTAPGTAVEEEIAQIWRELLSVAQVGIHDNFFELGGHSLLLTQLASRISAAFQVEIPLRVLFDSPTIIEMTVTVAELQVKQENNWEVAQMVEELQHLTAQQVADLLAAEA